RRGARQASGEFGDAAPGNTGCGIRRVQERGVGFHVRVRRFGVLGANERYVRVRCVSGRGVRVVVGGVVVEGVVARGVVVGGVVAGSAVARGGWRMGTRSVRGRGLWRRPSAGGRGRAGVHASPYRRSSQTVRSPLPRSTAGS